MFIKKKTGKNNRGAPRGLESFLFSCWGPLFKRAQKKVGFAKMSLNNMFLYNPEKHVKLSSLGFFYKKAHKVLF